MLIGIRRALALLILSFYFLQTAMTALVGPEELTAAMAGLAACYLVAFLGVAAEWFWARWFAMGVGNFGAIMLFALFKVGYHPVLAFIGGTHLAVMIFLAGEGMAAKYEFSPETQERYHFEPETLAMLRRAVKSAGSTLPFLILYALAPRNEANLLAWSALILGVGGIFGMLKGRTAGIFALAAAGLLAMSDFFFSSSPIDGALAWMSGSSYPLGYLFGGCGQSVVISGPLFAMLAGLCALPLVIFARPLWLTWRKG
jgi:hypothetical protein